MVSQGYYLHLLTQSLFFTKNKSHKHLPQIACYGSEENYMGLEDKEITAFVKYNYFHKEQQNQKKGKINPFDANELYYNKKTDTYYCPMGQAMTSIGSSKYMTKILNN